MSDEKSPSSLDVLGMKPLADTVKIVADGAVAGAAAFLGRICLPAAEEFGLLLRDKVSAWRTRNVVVMTEKAQQKLDAQKQTGTAHPRLVAVAVENSSWSDDDDIQEMWAGLLVSSCTASGRDDSNLTFMNILQQLTVTEVRLLNYACRAAQKYVASTGLIVAADVTLTTDALRSVAQIDDIHRIDREIDHLIALGLLEESDRDLDDPHFDLTPSALGLSLYVRAQGYRGPAVEFFGKLPRAPRSW